MSRRFTIQGSLSLGGHGDDVKLGAGMVEIIDAEIAKIEQHRKTGSNVNDLYSTLYKSSIEEMDKNLDKMFPFLKNNANQLYYDRKVEYVNLVDENEKALTQLEEQKSNKKLVKVNRLDKNFVTDFEKRQKELVDFMEKHDIKHPMRGQKYEHVTVEQQPFHEKIINIMGQPQSYLNYKKDIRQTMDLSEFKSEAYLKKIIESENKHRTIMKYRLYGRDGVTTQELKKLIGDWKVIPMNPVYFNAKKIKKRVVKTKKNKDTGETEYYSTDMSGNESDCYEVNPDAYFFNDSNRYQADERINNKGFKIQPLDEKLYGRDKAQQSMQKFKSRELMSKFTKSDWHGSKRNSNQSTIVQNGLMSPMAYNQTSSRNIGEWDKSQNPIGKYIQNKIKLKPGRFQSGSRMFDDNSIQHQSKQNLHENDFLKAGEIEIESNQAILPQIINPSPKIQFMNQKQRQSPQEMTKNVTQRTLNSVCTSLSLVAPDLRTIPGNPFKFKNMMNQNQNSPRKQLEQTRSKSVRKEVPSVFSREIQELIQKYRRQQEETLHQNELETQFKRDRLFGEDPSDPVIQALQCMKVKQKNQLYKKAFESIVTNIDKMEKNNKDFYKQMLTKMIQLNIRDAEILKLADALKEIDFAEPEYFNTLFDYHHDDQVEKTKTSVEIVKEYKKGQNDPMKWKAIKHLKNA